MPGWRSCRRSWTAPRLPWSRSRPLVRWRQLPQAVTVGEPTAADGLTVPDETWTVVQLRAEARARGLVGTSNKSKAQLLDALS